VVALITIKGWGKIDAGAYTLVDWRNFLLPYGAILFAVDGGGSMPIVVKLLRRDREVIKKVVRIGTLVPIIVIIAFTLVIVGISGAATTPDALSGIMAKLGDGMIVFALIFGVLTMVTSFLGVAESIRETLWWDYKFNKYLAWALAVFVPYLLYLAGFKNLIDVISFAGAVAGGTSAIILISIYRKLRDRPGGLVLFKRPPARALTAFLIAMFISGVVYELYFFIK